MIGSEQAARVACVFLSSYYKGFVSDLPALVEMYGERSSSSYARFGEAVATISQGKAEIRQHLESLNAELGPRKVRIRNADFVLNAEGSVAVTVSGQILTKRLLRVFSHTAVLAQTKYQPENTWYIAGDSLRLISQEPENIPAGAIIVAPGEEIATEEPVAAAKEPRQRRERKERPPREPKNVQEATPAKVAEAPVAASATVVVATEPAAPARRERKERKPIAAKEEAAAPTAAPTAEKPAEAPVKRERKVAPKKSAPVEASAPAAAPVAAPAAPAVVAEKEKPKKVTAAPAADGAAPRRTSKVRLVEVPESIRLSEVRAMGEKYGTVTDAFWFGEQSTDAVLTFSKPEEARAIVLDRNFTPKIRRSFFF